MLNCDKHKEREAAMAPAGKVAELLAISKRHVLAMDSKGLIPRPIRIGVSVRWNLDELEAWRHAGGPARIEWERLWRGGLGVSA